MEVEDYLRRKFSKTLLSLQKVEKDDLSLPNHLLGNKRNLIKLLFKNTQDLISVKNVLRPAADINRKKMENTGMFEQVQG